METYLAIASGSFVAGCLCATFILGRQRKAVRAVPRKARPASTKELSPWNSKLEEDTKLVLVVRTDLGMTKGKMVAQCCHAVLGAYQRAVETAPNLLAMWERTGQAKITLKTQDEDTLVELYACAVSMELPAYLVQDAGRTQIAAGSKTVLAIGPGPVSVINNITGQMRLL